MKLEDFETPVVDAMDALFAFSKAMSSDVSIGDLANVINLAVMDGLDLMLIEHEMVQIAIKRVKEMRATQSAAPRPPQT